MTKYYFKLVWELESDLSLEELEWKLDIWLLKYDGDKSIPEWDEQSISLEWYKVIDFWDFKVEEL